MGVHLLHHNVITHSTSGDHNVNLHPQGNDTHSENVQLPQRAKMEKAPTISSIVTLQESDILKYSTELKRFNSFWFNY